MQSMQLDVRVCRKEERQSWESAGHRWYLTSPKKLLKKGPRLPVYSKLRSQAKEKSKSFPKEKELWIVNLRKPESMVSGV